MDGESRLDALADDLAREHGLYERRWECLDERRETLTEIVTAQGLKPEAASYLACALADLASPFTETEKCKPS